MDPDPQIRTTDVGIRIWNPAFFEFFASGDLMITKNKFFCLLLFEGTFTPVFMDKKSKRSHKIVETRFFFLFFLLVEGSKCVQNTVNDGSGPGGPKHTNPQHRLLQFRFAQVL